MRLLACLSVLLGSAAAAGAQSDAAPVLDAVSIQDRPGFLDVFRVLEEGRFAEAAASFEELRARYAADPDIYILDYNLACARARAGQQEAALEALERAVREGYALNPAQLANLRQDPDLELLRGTQEYQALLAQAAQAAADLAGRWEELRRPWSYVPPPAAGEEEPASRPLLIVLHPYGSEAAQFGARFVAFARTHGFLLLAPQAGGFIAPGRFGWSQAAGDFLSDFRLSLREIWRDLGEFRGAHAVDPARIYVTGLGQGASLAFALAFRNPQVVRGGVLFGGGYAPSVTRGWVKGSVYYGRRLCFVHGSGDTVFPAAEVPLFVEACQARGLPYRLVSTPGEHELPANLEAVLADALAWIDEVEFPREPPPGDLLENDQEVLEVGPSRQSFPTASEGAQADENG